MSELWGPVMMCEVIESKYNFEVHEMKSCTSKTLKTYRMSKRRELYAAALVALDETYI